MSFPGGRAENVHLLYARETTPDCRRFIRSRNPVGCTAVDKAISPSSTGTERSFLPARIDSDVQTSTIPQAAPDSAAKAETRSEHKRGLLLIGLFKLSKATLSIALGVGALKLLHHDFPLVVLHVTDALQIDPESHLVGLLMSKADLVGATQLRHFSLLTFGYAVLCLIEGTGLVMEKRWAEYFTITLTTLALPWECYELYKEWTMVRIGLLIINLAVLGYLAWLLRREHRREAEAAAA